VTAPFRFAPVSPEQDRSAFQCSEEALDRYFQTQVTQDGRRRVASCFVAIEVTSGQIAGFYTIASASIPTPDLPPEITRRLPRYPTLPAVRIGRLAVDRQFSGRGLGGALLIDAARRTLGAAPATFTLLVDAKNEAAAAFYRRHGFLPLASQPRTLFLPIATAEKAWLGA
jgi:ribosomal protein S18 acetylase RimI-like enzyme